MALQSPWTTWAHLPYDQDWTMPSYIPIMRVTSVAEVWKLAHILPVKLICECMVFFMKNDTKPIWEDPLNKNGGYFSYKVINKNAVEAWRTLMLKVAGNTVSSNEEFNNTITGISVSPKKGFCIIKIWMGTTQFVHNPNLDSVYLTECRFTAHGQ